jgi:methyl-accepting chemotaxis protein
MKFFHTKNVYRAKSNSLRKHRNKSINPNSIISIRNKLIIAFMITVIPIVLLGAASYNKAKESIEITSKATSLETLKQANKYLLLSMDNIEAISMQIISGTDFQEYISIRDEKITSEIITIQRNANSSISNSAFNTPDVSSIMAILDNNKSLLTHAINKDDTYERLVESQIYATAIEKNGAAFWVGSHPEIDELFTSNPPYAFSSIRLLKDFLTGEDRGLLVIDLKPAMIQKALGDINLGENSELHLISPDGRDMAFKTNNSEIENIDTSIKENQITEHELFAEATETTEGTFNIEYKGKEHLVLHTPVGDTGFFLIGLVPTENFSDAAGDIRYITVLFTTFAAIIAIAIGFYIAIGMSRTINRIITASNKAADGDLTVTLASRRRDELGILTKSINTMISNMRKIIEEATNTSESVNKSARTVAETSKHVTTISHEVAKTVQEIAGGASAQAGDSEQGVRIMGALALKINDVSDSTKVIGSYSEVTINLTENGLASIQDLENKAKETTQITQKIITDVQSLEDHSKSIDKIVKVIGNIADQTNLLSLNAAIEAARAGEAGKGFAVVADEVRKLAVQSTEATREIASIIKDTQEQTAAVVERAISSDNILKSQNEAVGNTLEVFKQISDSMKKLSDKVKDIMVVVDEMDSYKEETISSIYNISAVSEQIAASTEEVSASTEGQLTSIEELSDFASQLEAAANTLNDAISKFKIK